VVKQILNFVDDHYVSRASGKTFVQSKLDAGGKLVGERAPTTTSAASRSRRTSKHPPREAGHHHAAPSPPAQHDQLTLRGTVVYGAVDVLDARYKGFRFTHTDVIADKASAGAFYLGPIARRPDELELHLIGCIVRVNGEVTMTVAGAAVMGHPAAAAEPGWPASWPPRVRPSRPDNSSSQAV